MKRFFKKYFIPHDGNEYKPHFLRAEATLFILGLTLLIEVLFFGQLAAFRYTNLFATILPNALVDETNRNRETDHLAGLSVNPLLEYAADLKAQDMAAKGYFAHTSPEGVTPWHWLSEAGYSFTTAGENLAVNFFDSKDVADAWMNSPSHRANILNGSFTEIGIGTAQGTYQGKDAVFVVQFFGRPALSPAPAEPEKETPAPEVTEVAAALPEAPAQEMFIAVEGAETSAETVPQGIATKKAPNQSSLVKRIASSPRAMTNYLFLMLLTIVAVALTLKIFVRINVQYPALIANGTILLVTIASALLLNQYLGLSQGMIF